MLLAEKQTEIILMGDFNKVEDVNKDRNQLRADSERRHRQAKETLQRMKETFKIRDVFRTRNGEVEKFTYRNFNQDLKSRLDRAYVTEEILQKIFYDGMNVFTYSDHDMYYFKMKAMDQGFIMKEEKKNRLWKYN